MSRKHLGLFVTPALLALTACATTQAASPGAPVASAAKTKPSIAVVAVSFATAADGWALAEPACAVQATCKATALMRKTADGGRTWLPAAAPPVLAGPEVLPTASPGMVSQILFTSSHDGYAYGPGLWRTVDGSARWQRVHVPGLVASFAVTGDRMVAVIASCDGSGECTSRVYSATAGTDHWRALPGTALRGEVPLLAVSGGTGYLAQTSRGLGKPVLLAGPVTGSARWRALPAPCRAARSAAIAAAPGSLLLGCGSEPGAGNQEKTAYQSGDGGRTWRKLASPPFGGYLSGATMTPGGTIFLSGGRMDVYVSRDRGRNWHESPSLAGAAGLAGAGLMLTATTVTGTFGVAVQQDVLTQQVWLTRDAGRAWVPVTLH